MALTETMIEKLTERGFNRWQKGNMDRMYINATRIGLELTYYKTGNISSAKFNDWEISNRQGGFMKNSKNYIDVKTGKAYSNYGECLKQEIEKILEELENDEV